MTLKQVLDKGILLLESENVPDAQLDAWYLLSYVTQLSKAQYFLKQNEEVDELTIYKYKDVLLKRASRIPLQHITEEQDFMGIPFWVNEHVLIPLREMILPALLHDVLIFRHCPNFSKS